MRSLFIILGALTLCHKTEAAVSFTVPSSGDATTEIAENSATIVTLAASSTGTQGGGGGATIADYAISTQEPTGWFQIVAATGVITLMGGQTLDYESGVRDFKLVVVATDNASPVASVTGTLTLTVTDQNDNVPAYSASTSCIEVSSTTVTTGMSLGTYTATDADTCSVLTYSINSGDDAGAAKFFYDCGNGMLSKTWRTFVSPPNTYTLVLFAVDTGSTNTGSMTLTVQVDGTCTSGAAILSGLISTLWLLLIPALSSLF